MIRGNWSFDASDLPGMPVVVPMTASPMVRRRALCTDHGAFVVINVYCPNAGSPPERARLPIKMRFLEALKRKADALATSGRQVVAQICHSILAEHE